MVVIPLCVSTTTSLVFLTFFLNALAAILPSVSNSELTDDFFKHDVQSEEPHHLPKLDVIEIRRMVADILNEAAMERAITETSSNSMSDLPKAGSARKRVFCNNFTGCGGRFRGRRRRLLQNGVGKRLARKRPFCNSIGCYNGRKRVALPVLRRRVPQDLRDQDKRLFCNGYRGCQNMGKRDLRTDSPGGDQQRQAGERREEVVENLADTNPTETAAVKLKRFLNGGFDENMEDILNNLKR